MGRKGMKGFLKSAGKAQDADEEAAEAPATTAPSGKKKAPAAEPTAAAADAPGPAAAAAAGEGSDAEGQEQDGPETRGHLLQRHKKEMLAHKKALQRSGKKSKDDVARLTKDLEDRHAQELAAFDAGQPGAQAAAAAPSAPPSNSGGGGCGSSAQPPPPAAAAAAASSGPATAAAAASSGPATQAEGATAAQAGNRFLKAEAPPDDAGATGGGRKPSKAQKRREKRAAEDADRAARIAEELAALGTSERAAEEAALQEVLLPLGLAVKEIRPDGHCLYSSVCDQLQQLSDGREGPGGQGEQQEEQQQEQEQEPLPEDAWELRELAAEHLRTHKADFAPFLTPEEEGEDPDEYYERYCTRLETTAEWGGHTELAAIAGALRRTITVYAAGMPPQVVGEEHGACAPGLRVCYLEHAFGLGQHYNSVQPLRAALAGTAGGGGAAAEEQEEQEEEEEEAEAGDDG